MPYFNNNSSILFGCSPPVAVGTTCRDNPDERKGGEFGTTTGVLWRCGWLEILHIRYSTLMTGFSMPSLAKLDVLLR